MTSHALHPFFQGLALVSILFAAGVWAWRETSPRHEGLWSSLRPRVRIPATARPAFRRVAPALFATWATGGFYLSLGVSISIHVFGLPHGLEQGAVVTALAGTGALACFFARHASASATLRFGTLALAAGTALTLLAIQLGSIWAYLFALPLAGAGFGTCFYGQSARLLRWLGPTSVASCLRRFSPSATSLSGSRWLSPERSSRRWDWLQRPSDTVSLSSAWHWRRSLAKPADRKTRRGEASRV
ncbi:hypothetical protein [Salipiger thiooxidans]|uniref:hypothetical protein n=1 Tax=Salipiger thiooxidans TaxID=282683 RepID=UPI0010422EBC|nr:hypothetical protein [Salipiger thiooxidans]